MRIGNLNLAKGLVVCPRSWQIRAFGDLHHSVPPKHGLGSKGQKNGFAFGVEAKMQKVSSVFAYVVSDGRVCALKPSEWSILLSGVALCGVVTMVVLLARI